MNYHIYMDESGNTGEPRYKTDKQIWNWGEQEYFALGGVGIPEEAESSMQTELREILKSFDPALGVEKEWKSRANSLFNWKIMQEVIDLIIRYKGTIYVDITSKRFKIVHYFVDYCIFPYYLEEKNSMDRRQERIEMANKVYKIWNDQLFARFVDLCHNGLESDENLNAYILFLEDAEKLLAKKNYIQDLSAVIERVKHSEFYGLTRENLIPIMDHDNRGNPLCFSPNVDAYLNIAATLAKRQSRNADSIHIFHDNQKQFIPALESWTQNLREQHGLKLDAFTSLSSDALLIQLSDFIVGKILRVYRDIVSNNSHKRETRELMKIIKPIVDGNCNVVSTRYEQLQFYSAFDLETCLTPIPVPLNNVI